MPRINVSLQAFNRGTVSKLALARTDVDRLRLSAEIQTNWLPRTLGPMMLRPGLGYTGSNTYGDEPCKVIPFIYSSTDKAAIEFTPYFFRVLVDDAPIMRFAVSTVVANFTTPASWTLATSGGGTSSITAGKLTLNLGSTGGAATATQTTTLGVGNNGVEHALRIVVERGPVKFRIGTTSGLDDLFATALLDTGTHSLTFIPDGTFYVQFEAGDLLNRVVSYCLLEPAGVMAIPTPYAEADLTNIRTDQSASVIFVACAGHQQQRIERRGTRSWSIVLYKPNDGPFSSTADGVTTLTPASVRGNTTLTASRPLFRTGHLGALFRLTQSGQVSNASLSAANTYSSAIRVTGVGSSRNFVLTISGTWVGTLTLQRSFDGPTSGFTDLAPNYTANYTSPNVDGLDNSIVWYRLGFKAGDYTSGTAVTSLSFPGGSGTGVARIYDISSSTVASIEILTDFSNTVATTDWKEGAWSTYRGWPTSVAFHDGRLWWAGNDRFWGSVSDNYSSFDPDTEGDSGPIDRTIGQGPIATINWLQSTERLLAGADASVIQAKSSSFDEPLTPTNFNLKAFSTQGAVSLPSLKVDTRVVYVQQSGRRVYQVLFDVQVNNYTTKDLTRLNEEIGFPGFVDLACQRQPDTSLHFISTAGTNEVLLFDQDDGVEGWWKIETDGVIENVYVLPGELEDQVYCVVRRVIGGVTRRYHERLARIDECQGGTLNKQADSFVVYSGASTSTITGLDHLEGEDVIVWADGVDLSPGAPDRDGQATYRVSGGAITLAVSVTNAVVGLPYSATFKSSKMAYGAQGGTALTQQKRLDYVGLIMGPTHPKGLYYGDSLDNLDPLPEVEGGQIVPPDAVREVYDEEMIGVSAGWSTDTRLHLKAYAPRPCTVMACVTAITTNG